MKLRNIFALLGVAAVVASCAPKAAPDPLTEALNAGELTAAEQMIDERMAVTTDECEIAKLTWTRDSIKLVRRDFRRDSAYVVDYIKKYNLTDVYAVSFGVDGLENDAIEYGCWTPGMDSSIHVEGLQEEEGKSFRARKKIGNYM